MNMMLRRRAMMRAIASASGPLYPMADRSININVDIAVTTSGNHVQAYTHANSRGPIFPRTAQASGSGTVQKSWPVWFSLAAGDEVNMYLKNISYPAASNTPYSRVRLLDPSSAVIMGIENIKRANDGGELHQTATIESDVDVKAIQVWNYRPLLFVFDIEIYVNGVRYV